jgi:hypothetical protein
MAADRSYIAENDRERRRLEALVSTLDEAALSCAMPAGWSPINLLRAEHRREHLDEIAGALARG